MASYGTNSLKHLNKISDHDVYKNQKRKYDLINGAEIDNKNNKPIYPYWRKPKDVANKITSVPANKIPYRPYLI